MIRISVCNFNANFLCVSHLQVKSEQEQLMIEQSSQAPTEMEVSSSMISTNSNPTMQNLRTEQQLCDPNSLVNVIPTSMGAGGGNMGIVSSGGNIIVATSNSIRTPINTSQFSTICIPSSAGVPIQTSATGNNSTKAIQLNQHFLIQKQQQQNQVHHIATAQPTAIQQIQANNNKQLPKQIIYTHHPATIVKDNCGTLQGPQQASFPKQKIIMSSANLQQTQPVTLPNNVAPQQQPPQVTVPVTRTTAFAQRVTHQATRLPMTTQQQVTVRPQKKDVNSITSVASNNKGRGGRANNTGGRPPPGAVNLERSYQICQAVILNSPNRHQLKAQLRPPQEFLAASGESSLQVSYKTSFNERTFVFFFY